VVTLFGLGQLLESLEQVIDCPSKYLLFINRRMGHGLVVARRAKVQGQRIQVRELPNFGSKKEGKTLKVLDSPISPHSTILL
jgi:hypothetical protein